MVCKTIMFHNWDFCGDMYQNHNCPCTVYSVPTMSQQECFPVLEKIMISKSYFENIVIIALK